MQLHNEQDAISQAVATTFGYDFDGYISERTFPYGYCDIRINGSEVQLRRVKKDGNSGRWVYCGRIEQVLQDPAFWQALGKEWERIQRERIEEGERKTGYHIIEEPMWKQYAKKWFETLMSGGDMKAFWESLP